MLDGMRRIVPWLVLAGCSSQGSLEVIVTDPEGRGVKTVELYVGYSVHHDEDIRPANGELSPTVWWKRDENAQHDIEVLEDGRALFAFLPRDDGKYTGVAALVAVGYGDDPTAPIGMATRLSWTDIPDNEIHRYDLPLAGFELLPRATPSAGLPGLRLWGPDEDRTRCVQVDNVPELMLPDYADRETGALPASAMIVRLSDPDCDGHEKLEDPVENRECLEYEYMAQYAMLRDRLQCALPERITNPFGTYSACVAGGATCSDGTIGQQECAPSAYCLPSPLCCADATDACDPYREDVLDQLTIIECDFLARSEGQFYELCPTSLAVLDLAAELDKPGLLCDSTRGAKLRRGRAGTWEPSISFLTNTVLGTPTTVSVEDTGNCTFTFSGTGPMIVDAANVRMAGAFSVPLDAPSDGRGLMLPIVFMGEPTSACPEVPQKLECRIRHPSGGTDVPLLACIGAPVGPGREVLD